MSSDSATSNGELTLLRTSEGGRIFAVPGDEVIGLGIDVDGHCIVKPVRDWFALASPSAAPAGIQGVHQTERLAADGAAVGEPMRIWIDCEFNEHAGRHELISMALVANDGREWYEVLPCYRPGAWVLENVIPRLGKGPTTPEAFAESLREFLAPYPAVHVIADWPSDIALFCDALIVGPGCRIDTPALTLEIIRLDGESAEPHNALADARGIRDVHIAAMQEKP